MSNIEKRTLTIVAAAILAVSCWQFSFARLAVAHDAAPAAISAPK